MRRPLSALVTALAGLALASTTLLLTSCGDDRSSGMIVTGDGRMLSNSAGNTRLLAQENIDRDLQQYLGEHWHATSSILQLPEWIDDHGLDADWRWTQCDATVEVVGDGRASLPIKSDEIRDGVSDYLRRRVEQPRHHLTVTVHVAVDAARFAALSQAAKAAAQGASGMAAAATAAPMAPAAANPPLQLGTQAYVIQAGDTLAEISAVFYGSTRYWRRILQANPGIDPNSLPVGQQILIPALNEPAPSSAPASSPAPASAGAAGTTISSTTTPPSTSAPSTAGVATEPKPAINADVLNLKKDALAAITDAMGSKDMGKLEEAKARIKAVKDKAAQFEKAAYDAHWSEDQVNAWMEMNGLPDLYQQLRLINDQEDILTQSGGAPASPAAKAASAPAPAGTPSAP